MREAPENFSEMRAKHTVPELMEIWGVSKRTMARWTRENGYIKRVALSEVRDQFSADAKTMTREQLMAKYGITERTVNKWCLATGVRLTRHNGKKPAPEGFTDDAKHMSIRSLAAKYNLNQKTISRMIKALGIERSVPIIPRKRREAPEGFADAAKTMTLRELAERFSMSTKVASRIIRQMGIVRVPRPKTRTANKGWIMSIENRSDADQSPAHVAANYLRKFDPVLRCNEDGKINPSGKYWHIRGRVVTGDELMEMAESKRERLARRSNTMQTHYFSL